MFFKKIKYLGCMLLTLVITLSETDAAVSIDVYKTNQITSKEVSEKFGKQLEQIAKSLSPQSTLLPAEYPQMEKLWREVISGIQSMGDFAYVDISTLFYLENEENYVTIDIVDKKDQHRLAHFLPKPKGSFSDPDHVIDRWSAYEKLGFTSAFQKKETPTSECPFHHCVYGFKHAALKPYKETFERLVPKNKKKLMMILRKDKDDEKRAAASFLLAHLKDPNEIIHILTPSIFDNSSKVRNAAMRVIGATLLKNKSADFPPKTALMALDFPSETDRNKALAIILALSDKPNHRDYFKKHASLALIDHLKMKQPNLYRPAYEILKKISGKNFKNNDYNAWEKWAKSEQNQTSYAYTH